ncbi:MAG: ABC transporter substrate-binding protein [Acidimicrobiales bacterium]|jgi:ABC-type branched-subunit amino acid transport system substrate-binding protein|nr:ABC transporter substrate-binding protein [Acidimicrobiales bacterium]MDP6299152.1 ABC transporter substrate-binding protein [Acidimicrobiales bacterium]HJM29436.1 ABC transporter substrate-binding protein [Acidimicrobiales bacterium]HJM98497.1 ABC transporter substrate-binding protein [Acidimicrobiales bacterium]
MRTRLKVLSIISTLLLITTSCGGGGDRATSTNSNETTAPTESQSGTDNAATEESDEPVAEKVETQEDGTTDTPEPASEPEPQPEPEPEYETFGDLTWPCNPGDASGNTEQGVTDESILIGGGDDRGYAAALGLNITQTDTLQAFVDKCNSLGGINGRQIEVELYDAKIFEVNNVWLDACPRMFMMVAEGFAVDGIGEESRVQCELAHIPTYTVSAAAAHGPWMIQPVPNPSDRNPLSMAAYIADTYPDSIGKSGTMYGNFGATIETKDKTLSSYPPLGFEFVINLEYNIVGEDDWTPFVLDLKNAGVEHVYFTGACLPNYQAFRATASVNGFEAIYTTDANFYENSCREANSDGVMDRTYVRMAFVPFEEREYSKAVSDYLDIMEVAGGEIALLGMQAASAFMLWATAAKACGSELTRECVLSEAEKIEEWSGGGLHVASNPGVNEPPPCGIVLELVGDTYERIFPPEPGTYACDDAWAGEFTNRWTDDAQLDENRVSQKFITE